MKKLIFILFLSIFILTGCFNPIAVSVIEDMYTAALMEEQEETLSYFSAEYLQEHSPDELSEELVEHVRYAGGIKLLNAVELTRNRLNEDIVAALEAAYDNNWYYVALDAGENEIMTWVIIKGSTQYEIVDGEKMTIDEYNDNVLK
ncbi:hypothetical protein [Oceanobacillus sp. CAU 1775]